MMGYGVAMPRHRSTGPTPPHATDCPGPCRNGLPQVPGHWEGEPCSREPIYNGSAVSTLMERTTHLVLLAQMKRMGCLECLTGIHEKNYGMYPPRYGKPSLRSLPLRPCDEFRCRFTHFFRNGGTAQHAGDFFFSPHPLEYSGRRGCPLAVQPLFHK